MESGVGDGHWGKRMRSEKHWIKLQNSADHQVLF